MAVIGLAMPPDQKRYQRASTLDFSCGSVSIMIHDCNVGVPPHFVRGRAASGSAIAPAPPKNRGFGSSATADSPPGVYPVHFVDGASLTRNLGENCDAN